MKYSLVAIFLMATTAFADGNTVVSPIEGKALNGPNGLLQLIEPRLKIGDNSYKLKSDDATARSTCAFLNRNLIKYIEIQDTSNSTVASFDENGIVGFKTEYYQKFIDIIVCK